MKHNSISHLLQQWCREAAVPSFLEPRDLQAYRCKGCGVLLKAADREDHRVTCQSGFARTGPDLRIEWPDGSVVYDVTVAHVTAPSYEGRLPKDIIAAKVDEKERFYKPILVDEPFVVLPFRSLGHVESNSLSLARRLARLRDVSVKACLDDLSVALARGVGKTICQARRRGRYVD